MAINKNHEFEELNGVKCGIVERQATAERVSFLKSLLEFNGYEVIVAAAPLPKTAPKPVAAEGAEAAPVEEITTPSLFTIGVTDYTFNPINAIFGRLLHTPDGHVVTLAYWHQKESISRDDIPYYLKA